MSRFTFPYPIKPWHINQAWGVFHEDPDHPGHSIYERFGYTLHNGTDVALGADSLIRSPFAGTVVRAATLANGQWQPNGGGIFVSVLSDQPYDFDDGKNCFVLADFLHCDHLLVAEGQHVIPGQPLAVADNTGFSTGPHTHIQLRRERVVPAPPNAPQSYRVRDNTEWLVDVDANQANGSFDPTPYFTNTYVIDDSLAQARTLLDRIKAAFAAFLKGRSPNSSQ